MDNKIITISREFGSGGRLIGERLAKDLGIPFYDKALIELASEKSGLIKEVFENTEKQMTSSLLFSIAMGGYTSAGLIPPANTPIGDNAYFIQADIIKEIANQGSCVIIGRCADYVLAQYENCYNFFVHANIESRKKRAIQDYNMSEQGIDKAIAKIDKARTNHYNYYTDRKWGEAQNYHLTFDTSNISIEKGVSIIKSFIE